MEDSTIGRDIIKPQRILIITMANPSITTAISVVRARMMGLDGFQMIMVSTLSTRKGPLFINKIILLVTSNGEIDECI